MLLFAFDGPGTSLTEQQKATKKPGIFVERNAIRAQYISEEQHARNNCWQNLYTQIDVKTAKSYSNIISLYSFVIYTFKFDVTISLIKNKGYLWTCVWLLSRNLCNRYIVQIPRADFARAINWPYTKRWPLTGPWTKKYMAKQHYLT